MLKQILQGNIEAACRLRDSEGVPQNFTLRELLQKPQFFDWVDCRVNDKQFLMFLAGADDAVAMRYFWNGRYEAFTLSLWSSLAESTDGIILDVGAHTGVYSLAALAAGASEVHSFEPHFANFARMQLNFRGNGFHLNHAHMLAVGGRSEWSTFHLPTALEYLSTGGGLTERQNARQFPIEVVALDEFLELTARGRVGVMKIDVEGLEPDVLRGAADILVQSKPIIFFECIDAVSGASVRDILAACGYTFFIVCDDSAQLQPIDNIEPEFEDDGTINMSRLNRIAVPDSGGLGFAP